MRTQRKNSRHTRKQNLACLTCVSFQNNGCVEVIIIIKVIFDSIRLLDYGRASFNRNSFSIILGLSNVLLLVPSTQEGGGGGYSVSQAQHGSPRLDQTQGLYLDSLSLKN